MIKVLVSALGLLASAGLVVVDPGHFHAALTQKRANDRVASDVRVFAPEGRELADYLKLIDSFNTRAESPTAWREKVVSGADYLERFRAAAAAGELADPSVVVLAGRNDRKGDYALAAVEAGCHVLSDKPMGITPEVFAKTLKAAELAKAKFKLGVAGWTYHTLKPEDALADMEKNDIHNHGTNPKYAGCPFMYPTAVSIMKDIAHLSPRVGLCLDLAYSYADGFDGAELIRAYHDRIFDVHLRNTSQADNGSSGAIAYAGHIDYRRVFRALIDVGYDRVCGLELTGAFEKRNDYPNANPNWVPLSMGYFRGLMDALSEG